jgi:pyruvate kinase
LRQDDPFTLTTEDIVGNRERVSVTFEDLPRAVKEGDRLFLNDGLVQLQVRDVSGREIRCEVRVGGELRSKKGLNLPGIELGISAFTEHDRQCLQFAMAQGVDAVSQSFVERVSPAAIMVPTESGATARNITRFRLPVWISAFSPSERTCRELEFSYGVHAVHEPELPEEWRSYAGNYLRSIDMKGRLVILTEGPSPRNPEANHSLELIRIDANVH